MNGQRIILSVRSPEEINLDYNFQGVIMMSNSVQALRFAGTRIKVNDEVVAKVTNFSSESEIEEEDVTGSEDIKEGSLVLQEKYIPVSVGETLSLEGIAIAKDEGQSELKTAAKSGQIVELEHTTHDGTGTEYEGFFTSYEEEGDVSDGVYTWSGEFRVNDSELIDRDDDNDE